MKLFDAFIEFSAKGIKPVQDAMQAVATRAQGATRAFEGLALAGQAAQSALSKVAATVGLTSVSLTGLIAAGVASSSVGQVLTFQMERLARTLAGFMGPELRKITELLGKLINWMDQLGHATKRNIAHWIQAGGVFSGMSLIFASLTAGAAAFAGAIGTALGGPALGAVFATITTVLGAVLGTFVSITAAAATVQGGLQRLWEIIKPLIDTLKEAGAKMAVAFEPLLPELEEIFRSFIDGLIPAVRSFAATLIDLAPTIIECVRALAAFAQMCVRVLEVWEKMSRHLRNFLLPELRLFAMLMGKLRDNGVLPEPESRPPSTMSGSTSTLPPRLGGMESITAAWDRIAQMSIAATVGKSPAEITNDKLDEANGHLRNMNAFMAAQRAIVQGAN